MAFDKYLPAVDPQPFQADGTTLGLIVLTAPWLFKTHQTVVLRSGTQPAIQLEVKRVLDGVLYVGPLDQDPKTRTDISAYTVGDSATIEGPEQLKVFVPRDELVPNFDLIDYAFESEPTSALRTLLVDLAGRAIDSTIVAGKRALVVSASVGDVLITYPTTPSIQNVSLPTANTEVAVVLPMGTARYAIRARGSSKLRLGFNVGDTTAGPYFTIQRGVVYSEGDVTVAALTLYVQADLASEVAEVLSWS